jgi:hypothetical protein
MLQQYGEPRSIELIKKRVKPLQWNGSAVDGNRTRVLINGRASCCSPATRDSVVVSCWFLPWPDPVSWCHGHKTVLIGAGVAAISFNSRMFLTTSRLSRAAMEATISLSRPISPGES